MSFFFQYESEEKKEILAIDCQCLPDAGPCAVADVHKQSLTDQAYPMTFDVEHFDFQLSNRPVAQ